jgi:type IV pilus assembly protein PilY1
VTEAITFDMDFDGYDDLGYAADFDGNVWRYDMASFPWTRTKLFDTGGQPIEARPTITFDEKGQVLVFFGTGKYIDDADVSDTSLQTIYSVIDDHSAGTTVTKANLVDQTSTVNVIDATNRGWFIDLNASGERVNKPAALAAGTLYMVSFRPNVVPCQAGGISWFWEIDYADGSNPDEHDGTEDDDVTERRTDLGEGIYSEPTIDLVNEDVLVQSTKTTIETRDTKGQILRIIVRSWRQQFN